MTSGTAVVILSRYLNDWYVTEALHCDALGYVVRQSDSAELLRAIRLRNQAAFIRYALSRGGLPPALPLIRETRARRHGRGRSRRS